MSFHVALLSAAFLAAAVGAALLSNTAGSAHITGNTSVFVSQSLYEAAIETPKNKEFRQNYMTDRPGEI